ncbi:MAG: BatD family protein, partial [Candidatus Cryptobacteroides sp.]
MKKFVTSLLCLFAALSAFAQNSIQVQVHNVVGADEDFRVVFVIEGENSPSDFNWECPSDFDLLIGPMESSSRSISIVNGKRTSSRTVSYTYVLKPRSEGEFVLPPATAKVKDNQIQSSPVTVKVIQNNGGAASTQPQSSSSGQGGIASDPGAGTSQNGRRTEQAQNANYGDIILDLSLDRTDVVVGQPVNAVLKIYQRANLSGFENADFPSFKGFWSQEVDAPTNIDFNREEYNGRIYDAAVLRRYVLIPQQTGKIVIEPARLTCLVNVRVQSRTGSIFDGFFDDYTTVRRKVESKAVTVNVSPLPAGAPASFGGGVGKFSISARLAKSSLKAHEANSLIITVSGRGNVSLLEQPEVEFPLDMEVYDTKITDKTSKGSLSGSKEFEYPFIPRSPGEFTIAPVNYTYYDVDQGRYVTVSTKALDFTVEKGADLPETVVSGGVIQKDVRNLGQDIRFISAKPADFSRKGAFMVSSPLFFFLCMLILLVSALVWYVVRAVESRRSDTVGMKTRKATKKALRQLKSADLYMRQNLPSAFYEELHKSLVGFVADKLNMPMSELSKENIALRLAEGGVPEPIAAEYANLLNECEFARYAPSSDSSLMRTHYDKAAELISTIDSSMKTARKKSPAATVVALLCFLTIGGSLNAAETVSDPLSTAGDPDEYASQLWDRANQAYSEGRWEDAVADYSMIVSIGMESAPLYYNLGNALYKTGSLSGAIVNYRRALKIDSSYEDARYNLEFARSLTQDRIEQVPEFILSTWVKKLCNSLSSDVWAILFLVILVVVCACVLVFLLSR